MLQGITKQPEVLEIPCGASPGRASRPQPFPRSAHGPAQTLLGFAVPSLHPSYSSCSQNPHWARWVPQFPPFPFKAAFPSPPSCASGFP